MVSDRHLDDQRLLTVTLGSATSTTLDHVRECATCGSRVRAWSAIRTGAVVVGSAYESPVPGRVLRGALARIAVDPPAPLPQPVPARRRLRWGWQLLRLQIPLVRRSLGAASALMLVLGVGVVLSRGVGHGASMLSLLAPLASALGMALIYGPAIDPPLELTVATGTSPRTVLLARLVLVCAYDFGLAVAATALTVGMGEDAGFAALMGDWFGPMLLLSALSLALAVLIRPGVGAVVALGLWSLRLMAGYGSGTAGPVGARLMSAGVAAAVRSAWVTSAPIVMLAAVLLVLVLAVAPRCLRLAS